MATIAQLRFADPSLGVDLGAVQELAASVEPYIRVNGTKVWSLMQLERPAPT
jgi:hypothetical protein